MTYMHVYAMLLYISDPHSFPWMVAMLIDHKSFCGGSVIDETHILTAGKLENFVSKLDEYFVNKF